MAKISVTALHAKNSRQLRLRSANPPISSTKGRASPRIIKARSASTTLGHQRSFRYSASDRAMSSAAQPSCKTMRAGDRKSVVQGTRLTVRLDHGGHGMIKTTYKHVINN